MGFRHDMKDKTKQQQMIVSKRDENDKLLRKEPYPDTLGQKLNTSVSREIVSVVKTAEGLFAVGKSTCPKYDIIITNEQCKNCEHFISFTMHNNKYCVECSYK